MSRQDPTTKGFPIELWQSFLNWPNLSEPRLVSKSWLAICSALYQQSVWHQATRCRELAGRLSPNALWAALLGPNSSAPGKNPMDLYVDYLKKVLWAIGTVDGILQWFMAGLDEFHKDSDYVTSVLKGHGIDKYAIRPEEDVAIVRSYLDPLIAQWCCILPSSDAFQKKAKEFVTRANAFKSNPAYEKQITLLLSTNKQPDINQDIAEPEAKKYQALYAFLNEVSAFEETILLPFSIFLFMKQRTNRQNYPLDLKVLQPAFTLIHRLSPDFYWAYIRYLYIKCLPGKEFYENILKNKRLANHLFYFKEGDESGRKVADQRLLKVMDSLWKQLPSILQANPGLYERMRPELWMTLGEQSCPYIDYFFQDRKIYGSLNSQQLRELVSENRGSFTKLKKEHMRDILSHIEILDLSFLRNDFEFDEGIPALVLEVVREKIKHVKSIEDLEKLKKGLPYPKEERYDKPILESLEAEIRSRRQLVEEKNTEMQDAALKVFPAIESDQQSLTENTLSKAELPESNSSKHSKPQVDSQKPISESLENSQTNPISEEAQPRQEEPSPSIDQKQATASQKPIPHSLEISQTNPIPAETPPQLEKPNPSVDQKQAADTSPKPQPQSINKNSAEQSQKPRRKRRRKKDPYLKALCSRYASVPRFIDYKLVKEKRAKTVISELSQQVTDYHKGHKRLVEIAKDDTLDFDKKWQLIQEECKSRLSPVTRWSSQLSLFGRPCRDNDRDLLYRAILNFDQLIESNKNIKTLLQLLMAQQKQDVMELCETERARLSGEDRDESDTTYFGCIPYKNNSSRSKIAVYEQLEQDLKDSEADESVQDILTDMPADTMNTLKGARSRLPLGSVTSSDVLKEIQSMALPILPVSNAF